VKWLCLLAAAAAVFPPPAGAARSDFALRFYGTGTGQQDRVKIPIDPPTAVDVGDDDILGWLNSDDVLLPGAVEYACHRMAQFPEVSWLTGRPCESDAAGVM
jgi:hypothetical protein